MASGSHGGAAAAYYGTVTDAFAPLDDSSNGRSADGFTSSMEGDSLAHGYVKRSAQPVFGLFGGHHFGYGYGYPRYPYHGHYYGYGHHHHYGKRSAEPGYFGLYGSGYGHHGLYGYGLGYGHGYGYSFFG